MRAIGVVTVGRSDYGIYLPVLRRMREHPGLRAMIYASGAHLSPGFGMTVGAIERDGFEVCDRIEASLASDSAESIAKSIGLGIIGFAQSFSRLRPDMLLVLGDRFEMYAAALAALPFRIPVAHIHGGELSEGAIDDALRHSMTKISHLHFVANDIYRRRVIQLGEEPWRVVVSGAPSLDNLNTIEFLTREELEEQHGLTLKDPFLLVTYHPVTLEHDRTNAQISELFRALDKVNARAVFTYPNADTGNQSVIKLIEEYARRTPRAQIVVNFGTRAYFSAMKLAAAIVGNSSSGIIEAASFKVPVVNVGNRQRGRLRASNVIDVSCSSEEIASAIRLAMGAEFRASLLDLVNPYGDGNAAERIVETLAAVELTDGLLMKHFHEIEV
jgi:UDP-hydrolysing UDP-N-acetyl-D-glucosamine 2-epimerase